MNPRDNNKKIVEKPDHIHNFSKRINVKQKGKALSILASNSVDSADAIGPLSRMFDQNIDDAENYGCRSLLYDRFPMAIKSDTAFNRWFFMVVQEAKQAVFNDESLCEISSEIAQSLGISSEEASRYFGDAPGVFKKMPLKLALVQAYISGFLAADLYEDNSEKEQIQALAYAEMLMGYNDEAGAENVCDLSLSEHPEFSTFIATRRMKQCISDLIVLGSSFSPIPTLEKADDLFEKMSIRSWHTVLRRFRFISAIPEINPFGVVRTTRNLDRQVRYYADNRQFMSDDDRLSAVDHIFDLIERRLYSPKYQDMTRNSLIDKKNKLELLQHLFSYEAQAIQKKQVEHYKEIDSSITPYPPRTSNCHDEREEVRLTISNGHITPRINHYSYRHRGVRLRPNFHILSTAGCLAASTFLSAHHHFLLALAPFGTACFTTFARGRAASLTSSCRNRFFYRRPEISQHNNQSQEMDEEKNHETTPKSKG